MPAVAFIYVNSVVCNWIAFIYILTASTKLFAQDVPTANCNYIITCLRLLQNIVNLTYITPVKFHYAIVFTFR